MSHLAHPALLKVKDPMAEASVRGPRNEGSPGDLRHPGSCPQLCLGFSGIGSDIQNSGMHWGAELHGRQESDKDGLGLPGKER